MNEPSWVIGAANRIVFHEAGVRSNASGYQHMYRTLHGNLNQVTFVEKGELYLTISDKEYVVPARSVVFFYAGIPHQGTHPGPDPVSFLYVLFKSRIEQNALDSASLQEIASKLLGDDAQTRSGRTPIYLPVICQPRDIDDLINLAYSLYGPGEHLAGEQNLVVELILRKLSRSYLCEFLDRPQKNYSELVHGIIRWITLCRRNLQMVQTLTPGAVAKHFRRHPNYINRVFKQETGRCLSDYIIKSRIEVSKARLKKGALVKEAAYEGGFRDERYFRRQFMRHVGISPGEFKNMKYSE